MKKQKLNDFIKNNTESTEDINSYLDFLKKSTLYKVVRTGNCYYWNEIFIAINEKGQIGLFTIEQSGSGYFGSISPAQTIFFGNIICEDIMRKEEDSDDNNLFQGLSLITGISKTDTEKFTYDEFIEQHYFHNLEEDIENIISNQPLTDFIGSIDVLKNQLIDYLFDITYMEHEYEVRSTNKHKYLTKSHHSLGYISPDIKILKEGGVILHKTFNETRYDINDTDIDDILYRSYVELFYLIYSLDISNFHNITLLEKYSSSLKEYDKKLKELNRYFRNKLSFQINKDTVVKCDDVRIKYNLDIAIILLTPYIPNSYKKQLLDDITEWKKIPDEFRINKYLLDK